MTEPVMEPEMTADEPTTEEAAVAEETMPTAEEATPVVADDTETAAETAEPAPEATDPTSDAEPVAAAPAEEPAPAVEVPFPARPGKGARAPKAAPSAEEAEVPVTARAASTSVENTAAPRGLRVKYTSEVVPALVKQFAYANPNQVPKLEKIVVNVGLGEALSNAKAIDAASGDLIMITGQKPIVMKARRSIAQFKIRTGNPIGLKVTLRGQRMWDFLERLTLLTLPRIRDFRGVPSRSFDGRGNYSLGMREQIAFPEIDYDKVDRLRGLEISVVTTAKSDEESKRLLELLGMPFAG